MLKVLLAIGSVAADQCTLSAFGSRDYWDWRFFGTGFIAGFYNVPPESTQACDLCVDFGMKLGTV